MEELAQFIRENQTAVTAVLAAAAALVLRDIVPGVWKSMVAGVKALWAKVSTTRGRLAFEERYRRWVIEDNRFLHITGIKVRSQVAIELDRVYVGLELRRRADFAPPLPLDLTIDRGLDRPEQGRGIVPWDVETIRRSEDRAPEQTYAVNEALRALDRRLVILGGPGSGKTTLLRYLAAAAARRDSDALGLDTDLLPVLLPLRKWVEDPGPLTAETLARYVLPPDLAGDCPERFFREHLDADRCLVLLDGMDEVSKEGDRARIARAIDQLVAAYPRNRYIVTSRPAGYNGVSLAGFTLLRTRDFEPDDVAAFAARWSEAVEIGSRGLATDPAHPDYNEEGLAVARLAAEQQADDLVRAIRTNDRVRRLAVNPLLLTIVALVHRYRATLPNRRADLYDECVQVLLNFWDVAKGIAGQMDWRRKRSVLEALALYMHEQRVARLPRAEVEAVLAEALPRVGEQASEAGAFLDEIRTRSGLLMEHGVEVYGFSHLTFQEYLAALAVVSRGGDAVAGLVDRAYESWWREVVLLASGVGADTPLLRTLLEREDDPFLTYLRLAAAVLAEAINPDPEIAQAVVDCLFRAWREEAYKGQRPLVLEAFGAVAATRPAALEAFITLLGDPEARGEAASALGQIGDPAAVGPLVALLNDPDVPHDAWRNAAYALGEFADSTAIRPLVAILEESNEPDARHYALDALGMIRDPATIRPLIALLDDPDWEIRVHAASGLIDAGTPTAITRVARLLEDPDLNVRSHVADLLADVDDPLILPLVAPLLASSDSDDRWFAALAARGAGRDAASLVCPLLNDPEPSVRNVAARTVGEVGGTPYLGQISRLLSDPQPEVRVGAAYALGNIGDPDYLYHIIALLSDKDLDVRSAAVKAITTLGGSGSAETLIGLLRDPNTHPQIRESAAFAIGRLGDRAAAKPLIALLNDHSVRGPVAFALGELGAPAAVKPLAALLDNPNSKRLAMRALVSLIPESSYAAATVFAPSHIQDDALWSALFEMWLFGHQITPPATAVPDIRALLHSDSGIYNPPHSAVRAQDLAWWLLFNYVESTEAPLPAPEEPS